MIERTDRVSTVIGRDETMIDVFVSLSPAFERLRSAGMRKVMARLVTVEQAARMAGVDADDLVSRLNAHGANAMAEKKEAANVIPTDAEPRPEALTRIAPEQIVELDVREELRAGREPFSLIMAALRKVPPGGAFCVRAIFEPVPLYAVMKRQGLEHWTERLAEDDWRVWFHPPLDDGATAGADAGAGAQPAAGSAQMKDTDAQATTSGAAAGDASAATAQPGDPEGDVVILDVRDLEPPEPMVRTLAALEELPAGATLLQINVRVPQFLLPMLEERGYTYHVREQEPDLVRVFIRRSN